MNSFHFVLKSSNGKTGPIPVTTSDRATCPDACPLKANGCYAEQSHLGNMWKKLSEAEPGQAFKHGRAMITPLAYQTLLGNVAGLPEGQLWRHNQAGDLPGEGDAIDADALGALVEANAGKRGFTYTHKPMAGDNLAAVQSAVAAGFTINLSANNLSHADELAATGLPVVVLLPQSEVRVTTRTPEGRLVESCPATYRDDVSCADCGLCARAERKVIVGFPAHGAGKRKVSGIAA